jgi:hypothetical protein
MNAATEATLMMRPRPRSSIVLSAACERRIVARTCRSRWRSRRRTRSRRSRGRAEARIVHEDIDRTLGIGETRCHGIQLRGIGQIGRQHLDRNAVCAAHRRGHPFERGAVACDEDEIRPAGGELPRELRPES